MATSQWAFRRNLSMSAISKLSISHKQDKIKNFKQEICVPSSENRTELEEKFSYILVGNSLQSHCIRLQNPVLALQPSTAKPRPLWALTGLEHAAVVNQVFSLSFACAQSCHGANLSTRTACTTFHYALLCCLSQQITVIQHEGGHAALYYKCPVQVIND